MRRDRTCGKVPSLAVKPNFFHSNGLPLNFCPGVDCPAAIILVPSPSPQLQPGARPTPRDAQRTKFREVHKNFFSLSPRTLRSHRGVGAYVPGAYTFPASSQARYRSASQFRELHATSYG